MLGSHGFQGGQRDFYCHYLDSCNSGRGFQVTARQESVFQWILALGLELRTSERSSRYNANSYRIGWTDAPLQSDGHHYRTVT